ncbi:S24 family peptidase [Sphingomonas sp. Leaf4]|uniref:S24 family peptidase n=1 Tax=Sphingomonas sp. Leaf4 TaxID=2876553 RepID=UPI001E29B472|nr:LexA family transcriptional regulator [Sphingomonas sp. Leaf4]
MLLVHTMLGISINAIPQEHKCTMQSFSIDANNFSMQDFQSDTDLVRALVAWSGKAASAIAREIGVASTTLTRPAKGTATTLMGRRTMGLLREAFPDYPGWNTTPAAQILTNAQIAPFEGEPIERARDDLPVWGTALGTERMFDGDAVEQTTLNTGEQIEFLKRPAILNGKAFAYALHVQGSSMHPALPDGEVVVACKDMPLSVGDNVVVYLRDGDDDDGMRTRAVLVKELVRRSASYIELRQYDPRMDFRVPMSEVIRIDRVLTRREMIS